MTKLSFAVPRPHFEKGDSQPVIAGLRAEMRFPGAREVLLLLETAESAAANNLSAVRSAILDYYPRYRELDSTTMRDFIRVGQIQWSDTSLASFQRREARRLILENPALARPLASITQIVDLGAGDGRMTLSVLEGLAKLGASVARVELVDKNIQALKTASLRLDEQTVGLDVTVDKRDFRTLAAAPPRGRMVFMSAALHELPQPEKAYFLSTLSRQFEYLMLVELSQDNDMPEYLSPDLAMRSAVFYDRLITDANHSLPSPALATCVGGFLLGELLQIWRSEYSERGNYHMTADQWTRHLVRAGFQPDATQSTNMGGLTTFVAVARSTLVDPPKGTPL